MLTIYIKTNAYQEVTNGICPLADDLHSVLTLLDYLLRNNRMNKKHIKEHSYGISDSPNIIIHGDNKKALKILQDDYKESVKCIYIDL